ncbi:MAG: DUF445 family protein [Anaerobutyricum sp.]|nr:DUF445 family protein [Anaerobutyricum sp.]
MDWKLIAVPVIGAIIGYATNWIAVKMLFRPHKEVRVMGWKLPFTPGVIPKGQGRLARAVGRAVEEQLLTREVLEEELLSEEKMQKMKEMISDWVETQKASEKTVKKVAEDLISEDSVEDFIDSTEEKMTDMIFERIQEMDPGHMIAEKVLEAAKEKLAESMFGMMIGGSMLEPIAKQVEDKINEYVTEYGRPYVEQVVMQESLKLQEATVGSAFSAVEGYGLDLPELVVSQYESIVREKLPQILETLHLSRIVEDRINAMEVAEVEELVMSIMKKELGAVVNLGALIGLLLGLVNVAILCL